ncbi:hypothetical protein AGMMS49545_20230 [Betaproteobacteria bacterium]|nr:hypothetical protein AGMMS49545_20230 [Betaproteobacteria bacterium]GHU39890.1 hypothetical protein AGMMS50289_00470 [Betaproteobacteria bacterium]
MMQSSKLKLGSHIKHPEHGDGTVIFVGVDHIKAAFDDGTERFLLRDEHRMEAARKTLPWPESTFVREHDKVKHDTDYHWKPVFNISKVPHTIIPEDSKKALCINKGYGDVYKSARSMPATWSQGVFIQWRYSEYSVTYVLDETNQRVGSFPNTELGCQNSLTLQTVHVWENGLEAQITARWGAVDVNFYDTHHLANRLWYEAGKGYDFLLAGLAYDAIPIYGYSNQTERIPMIFLPDSKYDIDNYQFRAPIKSVKAFTWLEQDGWKVRATVMRFCEEDCDLDIYITQRAWLGTQPPHVGQIIEGRLWLQGFLWAPAEQMQSANQRTRQRVKP